MSETSKEVAVAGSQYAPVRLRSFNDVMRFGLSQGWTADQVVLECKRRFGRIRCGPRHIRESFEAMKQANAPTSATGEKEVRCV